MKKLFMLAALAAAMAIFPLSVSAQYQDCATCDLYNSMASDLCQYCNDMPFHIDYCENWVVSTCGDATGAGLRDGCYPDWEETSRVVQGTYGDGFYLWCHHHSVQWVTQQDYNHCNINSTFWYKHYCHDEEDGTKVGLDCGGTGPVDCCNGVDTNCASNSTFTCNGYHSCTG